MKTWPLYSLTLCNVIILVAGQIIWKIGLGKIKAFDINGLITSKYVWSGLVLYGIATIVWFWILRNGKLSVVYPLQSVAYIIGAIAGHYFFSEPITYKMIFGFLFLILGVILIAL